jgi:hypothetical protein
MTSAHGGAELQAPLNYAADRADGGVWSNSWPERVTQRLQAVLVDFDDARGIAGGSRLEGHGFQLEHDPAPGDAWDDPRWVAEQYIPRCLALVQRLTAAPHVVPIFPGVVLRDSAGTPGRPPAAEFVHLDNSRESAESFYGLVADEATRWRLPRARVFNVWRAITPPPQDVPLALCDQRTVDEGDWVVGRTIEPGFEDGIAYVTSVPNPDQRWYFFSDLSQDEAIVFKASDSDPAEPMGCLHGAFTHPEPPAGAVPRMSVEARIVAFSET